MKRLKPPVVLFMLAPALGELLSGSSPPLEFFNPISLILLALMYGCGALLCRELVVRWQKGWPSLLLLGMAYGVYEEGIVVRSFFNPNWEDLDKLGHYGRVGGVNWVWVEHLTHFHALISICASIVLVDLLYPDQRGQRWLGRRSWKACWASLALWIPLGFVAFKYKTPSNLFALAVVTTAALVWMARHVPAHPLPPRERRVPRPRRFWVLGFVGMFAYFFTVYATADKGKVPFTTTMLLLAGMDILALTLVLRWSGNGYAWDDRHRLALVAGGLWFFIMFSLILESAGMLGMSLVGAVAAAGLWRLGRRIKRRVTTANAVAVTASLT